MRHRKQHAHTDTVEDPHSPLILGMEKVQLMNVFLYRKAANDEKTIAITLVTFLNEQLTVFFYDHANWTALHWIGVLVWN